MRRTAGGRRLDQDELPAMLQERKTQEVTKPTGSAPELRTGRVASPRQNTASSRRDDSEQPHADHQHRAAAANSD